METLRTFVAVELDGALRSAHARAQEPLRNSRAAHVVRWVPPASIHLTLKFLGDVPASRVAQIDRALESCCAPFHAFPISLTGLGCFPNARRPRVIWIGVGGDLAALKNLQHSLEQELVHLGFGAEKRGFTPHLTLGRFRDGVRPHQRQQIVDLIEKVQASSSVSMTVHEVSLIRSDLRPTGAVYSRLSAAQLGTAQRDRVRK
jgi:2'-5' RNA ligase